MSNSLTRIQASFLSTIERDLGRIPTISREDLATFVNDRLNQPGAGGHPIRFPMWITSNAVSRGVYSLNWDALDNYNAEVAAKAILEAQKPAPGKPGRKPKNPDNLVHAVEAVAPAADSMDNVSVDAVSVDAVTDSAESVANVVS